ncbi:hypothetical protein ARADI_0660 [Arsenophonus endosymbiont of Aleurodicus dispersus]|nr:hypothetical protein ARADI_0660 [Arsenophonus endosymbiont of Aleurodicus dispersus]
MKHMTNCCAYQTAMAVGKVWYRLVLLRYNPWAKILFQKIFLDPVRPGQNAQFY